MTVNQNRGETNEEPVEDSLSALKRLATLGGAGSGTSRQGAPSQSDDVAETIPDWLELLLVKYGEDASSLVGVELPPAQPDALAKPPPGREEASKVASLLDQMAFEPETGPPPDQPATSVDWGKPAVEEGVEEEESTGWRDRLAEPSAPSPVAPVEEEAPDWLSEFGKPGPEVEAPAEPSPPPAPEGEVPDWLSELGADAPAPELPAEPSPPPAPEGEVPDWLSELGAAAPGPEPTEGVTTPPTPPPSAHREEAVEGDAPDWLARLSDAPVSPEPEPPMEVSPSLPSEPFPSETVSEAPSEPEAEIPDWLHGLEKAESAPPPEPPSELPPLEAAAEAEAPREPEADIPDWLASLQADEGTGYEPPLAEAAAEAAPSVEAEAPPVEAEAPPVEAEPPKSDEVAEEPDWLAALRASSAADVLELDEEVVEPERETLPDWLTELRTPQAAAEAPPEEAKASPIEAEYPRSPYEGEGEKVEEAGALDWLAELEAIETTEESPPPRGREEEGETPTLEIGAPPLPQEETAPEWLAAEYPQDAKPPEGEEVPSAVEGAPPSEIPDWLRELEPREEEPAEVPQEEPVESEGVLAGLPGLLPVTEVEPEGEEEPMTDLRARLAVPEVPDVEGAQLFSEIAAESPPGPREGEGEAAPGLEPKSRRARIVETLFWALIFIGLIVAVAIALLAVVDKMGGLLGGPAFREFFGSPLVIDPAPVNTFRAQVTKLPPEAVVVVSFDYSPATEAEMDPLASIIVRDLLDNQARIVAVSLRHEGAAMAQRLLDRLKSEHPYGQPTLNLGYLPGQTAGVRSLAFLSVAPLFQDGRQTMGDYPAWQDVDGLDDVALIVDVADNPLSVRWWVEQVGPGTQANRPMVAAVSAAADPTVRPYYNTIDPKAGQLYGLVSGVTGAAAYENRLRQPGRAVESLAAQSVAHLGLVVLSVGGTLVEFRNQAVKDL